MSTAAATTPTPTPTPPTATSDTLGVIEYEIPTTMKRLVGKEPGKDVASCKIEVEEIPVPEPEPGEVLVKMVAAPVNPSDYGDWYRSSPDKYPMTMGKEGCGIVVKVGSSWMTTMSCKVGQKVGVIGLKKNQGTYSEYVVAKAPIGEIFPLPHDMEQVQDGASFFVNPYTTVGILETTRRVHRTNVLVHTAAASQLGQMMVKLAPSQGIQIINVVRRPEQAEILKEIGAKHIIVTADDTWKDHLKAKIKELDCKVAFDAVAGNSTGDMVAALPTHGTCYVYGGLAGSCGNISPVDLIYRKKVVRGWELPNWIQGDGVVAMIWRMRNATATVNAGLSNGGWSSTQFMDTTMDKVHDEIVRLLGSSSTGKKLRIRFDT